MRLNVDNMPKHLFGNVSVYLNGRPVTFGCLIADDHFGVVKRFQIEDGHFVVNKARTQVLCYYAFGEVIICDHWQMESRKILK